MNPQKYNLDESTGHAQTALPLPPGSVVPVFGAMPNISAGMLIGGKYEILGRIGAGGMGEVWNARDRKLERVVAIKRIKPEFVGDKKLLDRFFQEALAVASLNHPHIVQIFDRGSDKTGEFFVMEFVDGPSLKRVLEEQGAFDIERTVRIGQAMCAALQAAHDKGFLHRDVKPGNILLGAGEVLKLTDFGLARRESADDRSLTQGVVGTPAYMSPEQHEPAASLTPASDQWSLGATLYHLVTGQSPRRMIEARIPEPLRESLMQATEDDPRQRFANMREFGEALGAVLAPTRRRTTATVEETDLDKLVKAMQLKVTAAHDEARRLIEEDHDYAAAVAVLSEVPEHLRKAELFRLATTRRDRVAELDREISQRARELRLTGLLPLLQELLDLQPHRDDMRRLFATVQAAAPAVAVSASRPALLQSPFGAAQIKESRDAWAKYLGQPIEITNSIGMKLILIPPGEFQMGSSDADVAAAIKAGADATWVKNEQPRHPVRIMEPLYVGIYPTIQREWQAVTNTNPSHFKGERRPVEQVSWNDVTAFARDLSQRADEKKLDRTYRLPSEAEWEYFCRAGTETPFWFGSVLNGKQANVDGNYPYGTSEKGPYLEQTSDVGKYAANPFGLFDVHGNVWEWCEDWYDASYYASSPEEDPAGPTSGEHRVLRGGSWNLNPGFTRSAFRRRGSPDYRSDLTGFRAVCVSRPRT